GPRKHVTGELLVPVHGEAFLECELEPISASDPVPGPVMEILMANDSLDVLKIMVRGRLLIRKGVGRIEDVETLILHRTHVERVDGDDHVDIKVILQTEAILIPFHGILQGIHSMSGLAQISLIYIDLQGNISTALSAK